MYSQQKDIIHKVYGKCCISKIYELSVYSLCRFCLLLFCISYLLYVLVLSPFMLDTFDNESNIEANKRLCTNNNKMSIDLNALGNSESLATMVTGNKVLKRIRRQEPDENSSDTSEELYPERRSPFTVFHPKKDVIFILVWTNFGEEPFRRLGKGKRVFKKHKCTFSNCFITNNVNLFPKVTDYDVILFGTPGLEKMTENDLPKKRLPSQRYVFVSAEPALYNRLCNKRFDYYFNWTWTYKIDSDIKRGIVVRNFHNQIIGPQARMPWVVSMDIKSIPQTEFRHKFKAAAWWPTKCHTNSSTEVIAHHLKSALKARHLDLDIYGTCGSGRKQNNFGAILDKTYYFYLAFEDTLSPDYVTPSLLHALDHDVVPVVYGGADYTRYVLYVMNF